MDIDLYMDIFFALLAAAQVPVNMIRWYVEEQKVQSVFGSLYSVAMSLRVKRDENRDH